MKELTLESKEFERILQNLHLESHISSDSSKKGTGVG